MSEIRLPGRRHGRTRDLIDRLVDDTTVLTTTEARAVELRGLIAERRPELKVEVVAQGGITGRAARELIVDEPLGGKAP